VRTADFVVSERPDEEQVLDVRVCDEVFEELSGCRVQPLKVVKKECQTSGTRFTIS
jgi:hypothetical protein